MSTCPTSVAELVRTKEFGETCFFLVSKFSDLPMAEMLPLGGKPGTCTQGGVLLCVGFVMLV